MSRITACVSLRNAMGGIVVSLVLATVAVLGCGSAMGQSRDAAKDSGSVVHRDVPGDFPLTAKEGAFLDDLERRGVRFFVDEADPVSGLMPDRANAEGGGAGVASTASVGFGLTALCVGDYRGYLSHEEAYGRALRVLRFLRHDVERVHGFYYHFLDLRTGKRVWDCELSSIDTALLVAGALTVRQHFPGTEAARLAQGMYEEVEWPWMIAPDGTMSMGWRPGSGFIDSRWDSYNEGLLAYLLAIGSKTHPLPPESWRVWRRGDRMTYAGMTFMVCPPLFTHQYPQVWFDLRGLRDDYADYFTDSRLATLAQRRWCADELSKRFPTYSETLWGLTASDGPKGYQAWGGPPAQGEIDGSVVPCAAAGSLAFAPRECLDALKAMRAGYGERIYKKYGFVDAFNPMTGWVNRDVIGIDVGPSVAMAENLRSGFVWQTFMKNDEVRASLKACGFRVKTAKDVLPANISLYPDAPASGPGPVQANH